MKKFILSAYIVISYVYVVPNGRGNIPISACRFRIRLAFNEPEGCILELVIAQV
jgi:hypothetical protein